MKNFRQVCFQSHQNRLSFRIAEADVVLQDARPIACQHQADEKNAAEGKAFSARAAQCRLDDLVDYSLQSRIIDNTRIGNGAHAAGVRSRITFADSLVIARRRHQPKILAVRKQQD